ncbi:hypothetical protein SAMN04488136_10628 [Vibrio xiamenensis]|uniref:Uncharacterized protein n=1 Tax=Vibrio xiamenensis TaxID=861298 RepID=A0A1G7YSC9_9VIBR|nr:hypothetical protein [Vibrio xiamenensis]SDG99492.1 hypothetical protein SAMN04488136_10628 [Vibrio xiamenensis]
MKNVPGHLLTLVLLALLNLNLTLNPLLEYRVYDVFRDSMESQTFYDESM